MTIYAQDVKTLSDEELKILSLELTESISTDEDGFPEYSEDQPAYERWQEMLAEIEARRWAKLSPEEQAQEIEMRRIITKETMKVLAASLTIPRFFSEKPFPTGGVKIGDTITVKRPERFNR